MNERIQELAYLAEEYADIMVDGSGEFHPTFVKKFAELMVRECIEQVEVFNVRMDARPRHIVEAIKQHFGMEE